MNKVTKQEELEKLAMLAKEMYANVAGAYPADMINTLCKEIVHYEDEFLDMLDQWEEGRCNDPSGIWAIKLQYQVAELQAALDREAQ